MILEGLVIFVEIIILVGLVILVELMGLVSRDDVYKDRIFSISFCYELGT